MQVAGFVCVFNFKLCIEELTGKCPVTLARFFNRARLAG
jgi:hypothetical protein